MEHLEGEWEGLSCGRDNMLGKQQGSKRQEVDEDIRLTCSGKEGKGQE